MEVFANLVGVTFRPAEAKAIVKRLTPDDGGLLELEAEPTNEYDSHAVKVNYKPNGTHLGYISRENNFEIFLALEDGTEFDIEIVGFENTLKPTLLISWMDDYIPSREDEDEVGQFDD